MSSACCVIAEAGVNHNGDVDRACDLVRAAAACGADAIKFQTFRADSLVTKDAPQAVYQRRAGKGAESMHSMLQALELDAEAHARLFRVAEAEGIEFLSTPYDAESVELLESLGVARYKLPSGELTHHAFVSLVASMGKPLLISTGMADLAEVEGAVDAARKTGNESITLLHCTSSYPADPASANLRAMRTLRERFECPVGYSDHTLDAISATAAVALGACVVEKHFTLDCSLPGPDQRASLEPAGFKSLVDSLRVVELALGTGEKRAMPSEAEAKRLARRGLWLARDLEAGCTIQSEDVLVLRPATGLPASAFDSVIGRTARVAMRRHDPLREDQLA